MCSGNSRLMCWKSAWVGPSLCMEEEYHHSGPMHRSEAEGCVTDNFRGISLISVVYKILHTVLNRRLSLIAEENTIGLIADIDEQEGFEG